MAWPVNGFIAQINETGHSLQTNLINRKYTSIVELSMSAVCCSITGKLAAFFSLGDEGLVTLVIIIMG